MASLAGNLFRHPRNNPSGATGSEEADRLVDLDCSHVWQTRPRQAYHPYIQMAMAGVFKVAQSFLFSSSRSPRASNFGSRRRLKEGERGDRDRCLLSPRHFTTLDQAADCDCGCSWRSESVRQLSHVVISVDRWRRGRSEPGDTPRKEEQRLKGGVG